MVGKRAALTGLALLLAAAPSRADEPNWHSVATKQVVHLGTPSPDSAGAVKDRSAMIVVRAQKEDEQPTTPPAPTTQPQPANNVYFADVNPWTGLPWTARYGDYDPNQTPPVWEEGHPWLAPMHNFYGDIEILGWWTKGQNLPPLVTTGPATQPEDFRGSLGFPGTVVLFGGSQTDPLFHGGARFTIGYDCSGCGTYGIENTFFFLGQSSDRFSANSDQFPVIARPIFNVNLGREDRELTATPGTNPGDAFKLRGSIAVEAPSRLLGDDVNAKYKICCGCDYTVWAYAGFRYLDLDESLKITENVISDRAVPGTSIFNPGNNIIVVDSFATHNQFYGPQIGIKGEQRKDRWYLEGTAKFAAGVTHESIDIDGSQTVILPNGTVAGRFKGGLLAVPSNIGHFERNRFAVVPQVGLKLGYNVTDYLKVYAGYDFLYWSEVVRPGDQVDRNINVTQVPNFLVPPVAFPGGAPVRPIVPFRSTDYWAQGISVGVELKY